MGLQKVAYNFIVEQGGKLAKSLLCSKPQKVTGSILSKPLIYKPKYDFELQTLINRFPADLSDKYKINTAKIILNDEIKAWG